MLWLSLQWVFILINLGMEPARRVIFCFQPPQSFLVTMDEYIREAPRMVSVPTQALVSIFGTCARGVP